MGCCCPTIGVCWFEVNNGIYRFELAYFRNGKVVEHNFREGTLDTLGDLYKQLEKFSEEQVLGLQRARDQITSLVRKLQEEHDNNTQGTYQNPDYHSGTGQGTLQVSLLAPTTG